MSKPTSAVAEIREARSDEWVALGELTARAYAELPGMPGPDLAPEYYAELRDVAGRAVRPGVTILVAAEPDGGLLGGVTFTTEMKSYGVEAGASELDTAGVRMLAVDSRARGRSLGRGLTETCVARARAAGRSQVVLHTMTPMQVARGMYERMGFRAAPELDFDPAPGFTVMGFRLRL